MCEFTFPRQNVVLMEQPFSRDLVAGTFASALADAASFHGYLQVKGKEATQYLLFFLGGEPYAAGKITGGKPATLPITAVMTEILSSPPEQLLVSFHRTDPVLLKSMLVFLQEEPTGKVPVNLIDMEQLVRQIREEGGDALIVLDKGGVLNFYFFKGGNAALSHRADPAFVPPADLSVEEQMLLHAFDPSPPPPTAYIYRRLMTQEASDVEQVSRETLIEMLTGSLPMEPAVELVEVEAEGRKIKVEILDRGEQEIQELTLPCTVGRKDCDLLIQDGLVSRKHALIFEDDAGTVFIEDLKSTNGTFVNGRKVENEALNPLDTVTVGVTTFRISF